MASVLSSNLLFHYFVGDFIQDNGVCNVLNETEIVANFCKARVRGMAINFVGFWITILENTDVYFKAVFLAIDLFSIIAIRSVISLEIN